MWYRSRILSVRPTFLGLRLQEDEKGLYIREWSTSVD